MAYQDFRQFLASLRQEGELIDIDRPVASTMSPRLMKQSYVRQGPAMMFNQNGTDVPLVAGSLFHAAKGTSALSKRTRRPIVEKLQAGLNAPVAARFVDGAGTLSGGRLDGRCHRHHALSDPAIQSEGRRPLYHARYCRLQGSGDRRSRISATIVFSFSARTRFHTTPSPSIGSERTSRNASAWGSCRAPPSSLVSTRCWPTPARCRSPIPPTTGMSPAASAATGRSGKCKTIDLEVPARRSW